MKNYMRYIIGIIIGIIISTTLAVAASFLYDAKEVKFEPIDEDWNVDNVESAIRDIKRNYVSKSKLIGKVWDFDYNGTTEIDGTVQEFEVPIDGTYKIEVWGAQGGSCDNTYHGGYGAYSVGQIDLKENKILYITVGQEGNVSNITNKKVLGSYNGGGYGTVSWESTTHYATSGGGATHIAFKSGKLSELETYKGNLDSEEKYYISNDILIVAGGGGGSYYYYRTSSDYSYAVGANAGGISGNSGSTKSNYTITNSYGGTQTSGGNGGNGAVQYCNSCSGGNGSFGQGGNTDQVGSGGGSGFFGGAGGYHLSGGGGSSYIANPKLNNKAMYCVNCTESTNPETKTISTTGNTNGVDKKICPAGVSEVPISKCAKAGHGHARITLISSD